MNKVRQVKGFKCFYIPVTASDVDKRKCGNTWLYGPVIRIPVLLESGARFVLADEPRLGHENASPVLIKWPVMSRSLTGRCGCKAEDWWWKNFAIMLF
jgi:hypothetical protein